jgi:hypothetical protein
MSTASGDEEAAFKLAVVSLMTLGISRLHDGSQTSRSLRRHRALTARIGTGRLGCDTLLAGRVYISKVEMLLKLDDRLLIGEEMDRS